MTSQHGPLASLLHHQRSTNESMNALLIDGQKAYSKKQYEEAIRLFSKAIENVQDPNSDTVHLYELRSGTHVKLKRLDLALQDAKKMIRIDKADARGYVRCGQIEQLAGNYSSALKFFEHGVKHVSRHDPLFAQLEARKLRAAEALAKNIIFQKGTDPIQVLPPELLEMVLSQLSYMDIVRSLRVCKGWKARLSSFDIMRNTIDFSDLRTKYVTPLAMNAALKRLGRHRKSLNLANLSGKATQIIEADLKRWINWERLELLTINTEFSNRNTSRLPWMHYNLKSIEYGVQVRLCGQDVCTILQSCPRLERAVFSKIGKVSETGSLLVRDSSITIDLSGAVCGESLQYLVIGDKRAIVGSDSYYYQLQVPKEWPFPNLQHLALQKAEIISQIDLSSCTSLTSISLLKTLFSPVVIRSSNGFAIVSPSRLESLTFDGLLFGLYDSNPPLELSGIDASHISKLQFDGSPSETTFAMTSLVQRGLNLDNLTHLTLNADHGQVLIQHAVVEDVPCPPCPNLTQLHISHSGINDSCFHEFARKFPNIEILSLKLPLVTGAFIADLIRRPNNAIRSLVLTDCERISHDTIEWVQKRGINVQVGKSANKSLKRSREGSTVRYGD